MSTNKENPIDASQSLKALGESGTRNEGLYKFEKPDPEVLESFEFTGQASVVEAQTEEFTCLCPKTGQPDFAVISIRYVPNNKCVESKSLKLYLMGYRNYGCFHEHIVNKIAGDLQECIGARRLEVIGNFKARGGITFRCTAVRELAGE